MAVSLAVASAVAVVAFVAVRHTGRRLDRQIADARLCTRAASTLELVAPNMAAGAPSVGFTTSRSTAGRIAAELARTGASSHPWDQEPRDTVVVRCASGNLVWVADAKGHAARMPAS